MVTKVRGHIEAGMFFAIKAGIGDPAARTFAFPAQKTMYGGKRIARADTIYVFASENEGGHGLVARGGGHLSRGDRTKARHRASNPAGDGCDPVYRVGEAAAGRSELKPFTDGSDGRPETELNFKYYRQATNKIVGITDNAAAFLDRFF